jgi:hypothetical protein
MNEVAVVKKGGRPLNTSMNVQRELCVANYTNPESPTFGNVYKSALSAGFNESYARALTSLKPKWFGENTRHGELMELAEAKLKHYLTFEPIDGGQMKIQQDTAKFVASNLGKEKYSVRQEVRSDRRNGFSPQTKLVVEKVLDDFLQPKETRVRIEQTL